MTLKYPKMAHEESQILQLPVELLELICNRLDPYEILSFRLASTTFADISFESFISCYVEEVSCFFPDPARVQRLANILSHQRLADRLRTLYLTLDAFEYKEDEVSFAVPAHDRGDTLPEYKRTYQMQELAYHCTQRQSLVLLTQSLKRLNPMRCKLHLDLSQRQSFPDHTEWTLMSQKVLAAIERALYPIYDLTIMSMRDQAQPGLLPPVGRNDAVRRRDYHELYYTPYHSTRLDDLGGDSGLMNNLSWVMEISGHHMPSTKDLESLDIIYWIWPTLRGTEQFTSRVLPRRDWWRLKRITFVRVTFSSFKHLFHVLRCCHDMLEILTLNEIEVYSADGHEWKHLFELLGELPNLEHLQIRQLWWNRGNDRRLLVLDGKAHVGPECRESGHTSIKAALTQILELGLTVRDGSELVPLR